MENPFSRRASELLRDEEAFLAVVSPEPVMFFLRKQIQAGTLCIGSARTGTLPSRE
jgi:hypothetical protein